MDKFQSTDHVTNTYVLQTIKQHTSSIPCHILHTYCLTHGWAFMYVAGHSGEITTAVRWSDEYNVLQQAKMAPRLWDVLMGSSHNERGFRQVEICSCNVTFYWSVHLQHTPKILTSIPVVSAVFCCPCWQCCEISFIYVLRPVTMETRCYIKS